MKKYIPFYELEIYKIAKELSKIAWQIYQPLDWNMKKTIGNQYISSTDSIGANIAEAYGRFHYLDRIKFLYNARGSLIESLHWVSLLEQRDLGDKLLLGQYRELAEKQSSELQNFINSTYRSKSSS